MSGALKLLFIKNLVNTTCLQRYGKSLEPWEVTLIWSFVVSIFSIGGLLGTLCAGRLTAAYGRKRCLLLNNVVAVVASVMMLLSKIAMSFEMIMVARLLYGVNAGVAVVVHAIYLVECAPKRLRGMVGVSVSTFVSLGIFTGQLLGLSELLGTEELWPWLLGFSGATALLQLATLPLLPESPRYLLLDRGDRQGCENAIRRLWGNKDHSAELEDMLAEHNSMKGVRSHSVLELILDQAVRWQLLTILVTFTTLQFCGINAVYLYSFEVFSTAGIPTHQLRHVALGTAGVTAPLPGEIFNQSFKSAAFTVACTINWLGLFLLGLLFPLIVEHLDYFCFLIFFLFCLLSGVFVWYNVPETKNRTIMEINAQFRMMHPIRGFSEDGITSTEFNHVKACTDTKL
ncbi:hypothetical protein DPEC_G00336390 [Dallia pectoralis]|uniref:Uncharacterized protein n=1 Tax=Dallia pectoralis TaxID=75939 RepID=A0ACC2F790_DALPE|nr:hypothetical protein DPEC_G00336390 [Dallia pectoralis]